MFSLPLYRAPDFDAPRLKAAPDACLIPAPDDFVAPENYHAMSIYPEYFKVDGRWLLAKESRMDCVPVLRGGQVEVIEFRHIKKGDLVFTGRREDGSEGIFLHTDGFLAAPQDEAQAFSFREGRSRETAYSKDYRGLYELLKHERAHGKILWVMGPACVFDADARAAFASLVREGYVNGLMAGNAFATHDLEGGLLHTALGQDIYTQESVRGGHYHHLDVLNKVRAAGSIRAFLNAHNIQDGVMRALTDKDIPFVLAGSIRDDGPLPPVYANVYQAQDAMRGMVRDATTIVCLATALHTIAVGNMTPSFRVRDGAVRPVYFFSVDISEFAVNKLRDRGSLSVKTFVTNAQDFLVNVQKGLSESSEAIKR